MKALIKNDTKKYCNIMNACCLGFKTCFEIILFLEIEILYTLK